jgi:glycosyltransferase involved in cell wall biosynthesis
MTCRLLLINSLHHKNEHAILNYKNISITRVSSITDCPDPSLFDAVYSPSYPIDVVNYPTVKKFIFGPHLGVFPEEHFIRKIQGANSFYIQPSEWAVSVWKSSPLCSNLNLRILPFGVDTDLFSPLDVVDKPNVFVYLKRRKPEELEVVQKLLHSFGIPFKIFVYGSYSEKDYLSYLQTCKYGIWLDAHESQGFALEEALSINVPLLVWNIRSMSEEYGYSYPYIPATTVPYWDVCCGEVVYSKEEFTETFPLFLSKLDLYTPLYTPREFVIKELSIDVCEKRLIELIRE